MVTYKFQKSIWPTKNHPNPIPDTGASPMSHLVTWEDLNHLLHMIASLPFRLFQVTPVFSQTMIPHVFSFGLRLRSVWYHLNKNHMLNGCFQTKCCMRGCLSWILHWMMQSVDTFLGASEASSHFVCVKCHGYSMQST